MVRRSRGTWILAVGFLVWGGIGQSVAQDPTPGEAAYEQGSSLPAMTLVVAQETHEGREPLPPRHASSEGRVLSNPDLLSLIFESLDLRSLKTLRDLCEKDPVAEKTRYAAIREGVQEAFERLRSSESYVRQWMFYQALQSPSFPGRSWFCSRSDLSDAEMKKVNWWIDAQNRSDQRMWSLPGLSSQLPSRPQIPEPITEAREKFEPALAPDWFDMLIDRLEPGLKNLPIRITPSDLTPHYEPLFQLLYAYGSKDAAELLKPGQLLNPGPPHPGAGIVHGPVRRGVVPVRLGLHRSLG